MSMVATQFHLMLLVKDVHKLNHLTTQSLFRMREPQQKHVNHINCRKYKMYHVSCNYFFLIHSFFKKIQQSETMSHIGWVLTVNNPIAIINYKPLTMDYMICALQRDHETSTLLYKGVVIYKKPKTRRDAIVGLCYKGDKSHVKLERSRDKDPGKCIRDDEKKTNIGEVYEYGKVPEEYKYPGEQGKRTGEQGKRTDLHRLQDMIKEGATPRELREALPATMARYRAYAVAYKQDIETVDLEDLVYPVDLHWFKIQDPSTLNPEGELIKNRHIWLWGPPTAGKSHMLQKLLGNKKVFWAKATKDDRYEDYDNEDIIVFQETTDFTREEIINITDTYEGSQRVYGKTRYTRQYYKRGHSRTIIWQHSKKPPQHLMVFPEIIERMTIVEAKGKWTPAEEKVKEPVPEGKEEKKERNEENEEIEAALQASRAQAQSNTEPEQTTEEIMLATSSKKRRHEQEQEEASNSLAKHYKADSKSY
jgi:hypothetical protein